MYWRALLFSAQTLRVLQANGADHSQNTQDNKASYDALFISFLYISSVFLFLSGQIGTIFHSGMNTPSF